MTAQAAQPSTAPVLTVTNGIFPSNCYVCRSHVPGECFIVDPGLEAAPIEAALAELKLTVRAVLCTHGHFDHAGTASHFQQRYDCPVYLHERDIKTVRSSNFLLMAFKIPARIQMPDVIPVTDSAPVVRIGDVSVRYHPVPGHTPGSCLIEHAGSIFSGDTLYSRGVGLSKLPGEDPAQLRDSIRSVWARFADDAMVRPGHGESARMGWIKQNNTALLRFLGSEPPALTSQP